MARARDATKELGESFDLLRSRRFGTFWFASFLSNIGTWAQQVAEPWLLLSLGASSFLVGLDSFAMNVPIWFLTLVGGALADRADRRRVIALFQSVQMLCPALIVLLLLTNSVRPWVIIVAALVVGITDALSMPSFQSIVPSIVEREQIGRGIALNSTQFNLSRILGPALAGVIMASVGAIGCFVVSAASYVPFIGVALWILPRRSPEPSTHDTFDGGRLLAGVRGIMREPRLGFAVLTVLVTSLLCAPLITFSPVLVRDVFHGGAGRFSSAVASFGVGGLLGATSMLAIPLAVDRRRLSSRFALGYGLTLVLAALNPWFWGLPVLLVVAGAAMTVSNTAANSLLQATANRRLLGQTVSLFMLAVRGGLALGSLAMGLSVSLLGVRYALLVHGTVAMLAHATIGRLWIGGEPKRGPAIAEARS
jgi:MFS family permease